MPRDRITYDGEDIDQMGLELKFVDEKSGIGLYRARVASLNVRT